MATNLTDLTVSGGVTTGTLSATSATITGAVATGQIVMAAATAHATNGAIDPATIWASLTKGSAGAYTLAAPGASNVGKVITITAGSAYAHVVTVTGLVGGNTLTFTNAIGHSVQLLAVSATVWGVISIAGAALSTV